MALTYHAICLLKTFLWGTYENYRQYIACWIYSESGKE